MKIFRCLLIILILSAAFVQSAITETQNDIDTVEISYLNNECCLIPLFDIGVGEPSNIMEDDIRFLGEDTLQVTVQNFGDIEGSVGIDFSLEYQEGSEWVEVDSTTNGPYDIDPEAWIESFFDVSYDFEGEYRATFRLDEPMNLIGLLNNNWSDDDPSNDEYQVNFTVSRESPFYIDFFVEFEFDGEFEFLKIPGFGYFFSGTGEVHIDGLFEDYHDTWEEPGVGAYAPPQLYTYEEPDHYEGGGLVMAWGNPSDD